jgi:hypothetical protein
MARCTTGQKKYSVMDQLPCSSSGLDARPKAGYQSRLWVVIWKRSLGYRTGCAGCYEAQAQVLRALATKHKQKPLRLESADRPASPRVSEPPQVKEFVSGSSELQAGPLAKMRSNLPAALPRSGIWTDAYRPLRKHIDLALIFSRKCHSELPVLEG